MDIIAAHRQGLIEKLDEEAAALAGRPKDFAQRAVVLHHLYDHSGGNHEWALAEARGQLRTAAAILRLRKRLSRWGWLVVRRDRAEEALNALADSLGKASQARCMSAYVAYRLSGIRSLKAEAGETIPADLFDGLVQCHAARRSAEPMDAHRRQALFDLSEERAAASTDRAELDNRWDAIGKTGLKRAARRLLGPKAAGRALARDRKRDAHRIERELRDDPQMPASFRANPAQHFYALQNMIAERRRQQWREACDLETDAFELAA